MACGPGWGRVSMALSAREREEIVDGLPAGERWNQMDMGRETGVEAGGGPASGALRCFSVVRPPLSQSPAVHLSDAAPGLPPRARGFQFSAALSPL